MIRIHVRVERVARPDRATRRARRDLARWERAVRERERQVARMMAEVGWS